MKLIKLSLEGLFSYKEKSSVYLDDPGLVLVNGEVDNDGDLSNGAGKTSIIDAICLCLFKCTTRGTENDDVVNDDMTNGWASLTFMGSDQAYQAQYERDKSLRKTIWKIYQQMEGKWVDISGKTLSETEQIIESIIGMNYKTFSNSILFAQNGVSLFLEGRDSDRKKLFTQILDLDALDAALQTTRDSASAINKQIGEASRVKETHEATISQEKDIKMEIGVIEAQQANVAKQISETNTAIKAHNDAAGLLKQKADLGEKITTISRSLDDLEGSRKRAESAKSARLSDCQRSLEAANEQLEKIKSGSADLEEVERHLGEIEAGEAVESSFKEKKDKLEQDSAIARTEISQRQKEIKVLDAMAKQLDSCDENDHCPYCAQSLDDTARQNVHLKIDMEREEKEGQIDDLEFEIRGHAEEVEKLEEAFEPTRKLLDGGKTRKALVAKQQKVKALVESKPTWEAQVKAAEATKVEAEAEYQEAIASINERKKGLEGERETLESTLASVNAALADAYIPDSTPEQLSEDLKKLNAERDKLIGELGGKKQALENIKQAKAALKDVKEQIENLQNDLAYEKFLEEMFGADGIKALIINSVTPRLTDLANQYLLATTDKPISIEFVTSYEGKSKTIEDFKILVTRGLKTSDVRSFSGGEKKKIEFAVRFAVSDIIREKAGCNAEFLFLDEPFDGLDEKSIAMATTLLRSLGEQFPTIFAMCHIAYAKDQFDREILVRNVGGASRIVEAD
ncbi:MAG: SMC family ATPase [Candidatus Izemoplasmatales bacterium]